MRALRPLTSLLCSTALLLLGHGMQLTLLPLRASQLGHSDLQIALAGAAYFAGFITGCLFAPPLIARVGHIRSFAVLASAMTGTLLFLSLSDLWPVWLLLRFLIGVLICSLYTVIESWLNDQAGDRDRGQILAVYTFLGLLAMAVGQQLVALSPVLADTPFIILAALISLSVIPVGSTRGLAPAPIESTQPRFRRLYRRSPAAFIAALLSGGIGGSFWSLAALFARGTLADTAEATRFMAAAVIGGALAQYPFGWLSDRAGTSRVLMLLFLLGAFGSASVATTPAGPYLLPAVFAFGATTMPIYAMALATAASRSRREEFVEIGTSVLLLSGLGAVLAPLVLGPLMQQLGDAALFWGCAALCAAGLLLTVLASLRPPRVDEPVPFAVASSAATPTSLDLDPRAPEDASGDLAPASEAPSIEDSLQQDDDGQTDGEQESSDSAGGGPA